MMPVFDNLPGWYFLVMMATFFAAGAVIGVLAYLTIRKRPFVTLSGWSKYGGFSLEARDDLKKPEPRR